MIEKRKERIRSIQKEIKEYQEMCPHFDVIITRGSNTGNWCKEDDCYWTDYKCPYCGKFWSVES